VAQAKVTASPPQTPNGSPPALSPNMPSIRPTLHPRFSDPARLSRRHLNPQHFWGFAPTLRRVGYLGDRHASQRSVCEALSKHDDRRHHDR
jgi:hypothetical protein